MEQQFSLSWNNFHGNLSKGFAGLLGNGEFVDVTIAVEGHLLQAHKVILSICSPYFKKMFQMNPCQHPIVVLRDVTHKAMRDLLQFMYHGEVSVKREDLTSFISTAEALQIKGLTNKQTDDEPVETEQEETQKHGTETQNGTLDADSNASDPIEAASTEEVPPNNELDLLKQRQFIERLQRFSNLKRKSEEFLQKSYYTPDIFNFEKKQRKDKPHKQNNSITPQNNYNQFVQVYKDTPIDTARNYSLNNKPDLALPTANNDEIDKCKLEEASSDGTAEVKAECEDGDIIVTDPAICTTPKSYDTSREGHKERLEYNSPQENALSLVVNGSTEHQQLPLRYKYIYSRKGHKQLVHMNFVYTKHSTSHGKTAWRCVQYFSLNRCPATVETIDAMIYATNHQHNHEDCYEKLTKNNIYYETNEPKT